MNPWIVLAIVAGIALLVGLVLAGGAMILASRISEYERRNRGPEL